MSESNISNENPRVSFPSDRPTRTVLLFSDHCIDKLEQEINNFLRDDTSCVLIDAKFSSALLAEDVLFSVLLIIEDLP